MPKELVSWRKAGFCLSKAGWQCGPEQPGAAPTVPALRPAPAAAQSYFLTAASARLPAAPKESPSPGLGPSRRSAQRHHPVSPAGSFVSSWSPLGLLTQLKACVWATRL